MKLEYIVKNNQFTINQILQNELQISSRLLYKLIRLKRIFLNGELCDTRKKVLKDDVISIDFNYEEDNSNIIPTRIDLNIIYEDNWLLIVNKPAGIAIHPSILHYSDSLSNGIRFYFDSISLNKKIRPVNRLDSDTSGLVIFAKCEYIQECLILQMKKHIFQKEYLAICKGRFDVKSDTISLPIARKENSIIERCISKDGQISITHYEVLKQFNDYAFVKCILETGRTHQIRVHLSAIGNPLIGDSLYGSSSNLINRQALHCYTLKFIHPITKQNLEILSELPSDFKKILKE